MGKIFEKPTLDRLITAWVCLIVIVLFSGSYEALSSLAHGKSPFPYEVPYWLFATAFKINIVLYISSLVIFCKMRKASKLGLSTLVQLTLLFAFCFGLSLFFAVLKGSS